MPVVIIALLLQVALVVHVVRTERDTKWIWIVLMLPLVGALAYLIVEVIPELRGSHTAARARKNLRDSVNPARDPDIATNDLSITNTAQTTLRLAHACLNKKMYDEAKHLYQSYRAATGSNEPEIIYALAKAEFGIGNFTRTKSLLDELSANNPGYRNKDAQLLYAMTVEELGEITHALHEYELLDGNCHGAEAVCRRALLLKRQGEHEIANKLFKKIIHLSKTSGKHYNETNQEWIRLAKNALN